MPAQPLRSAAKLEDWVSSILALARSDIITRPAQGWADQPFCGAEISTSTPVAAISTQIVPDAMQSSTKSASTSWAASASAAI